MNRRQFIERTSLAAVGALGLPFAGGVHRQPRRAGPCRPRSAEPAPPKPGGVFPTYVPFPNKPTPEYPSSGDPYLDGYDNFPKNPQKALAARSAWAAPSRR